MKRLLPFFLFAICGLFLTACQQPTENEKIKQEFESLMEWQKDVSMLNTIAQAPFLRDGKCKNLELNFAKRGEEYCHLLSTYDKVEALSKYETLIDKKFAELEKIPTTTLLIKDYREKMQQAVIQQVDISKQILFLGSAIYNVEQQYKADKEYTDAFVSTYKFTCEKFDYCKINESVLGLAGEDQPRIFELARERAEKKKKQAK